MKPFNKAGQWTVPPWLVKTILAVFLGMLLLYFIWKKVGGNLSP